MSILSDILSRIKQQQPKRDVPPGLRSTIAYIKQEDARRRKMFLFVTAISIFFSLCLSIIYLADYFIPNKGAIITAHSGRRTHESGQSAALVSLQGAIKKNTAPLPTQTVEPAKAKQLKASPHVIRSHHDAHQTSVTKKEATLINPQGAIRKNTAKIREIEEESLLTLTTPKSINYDTLDYTSPTLPTQTVEPAKAKQPPINRHIPQRHEESVPGLKEGYIYSAEEHENNSELTYAASDYRKVLDLEPDNFRIMNKIASLLIKMGRYDDAAKHLINALNLKPDYIPALVNSAIASAKTGKTMEAESSLLNALSIDGTSQAVLLNIALLYELEKKYEEARDYFSRLRKLGNKNGEHGIKRLENIQ